MISRRRIAVAILCTIAFAALNGPAGAIDPPSADESAPSDLWLSPGGMLRMNGIAWRWTPQDGQEKRYTAIVVSAFPAEVPAEGALPLSAWARIRPARTIADDADGALQHHVSTVHLVEGCAYVKMGTSPQGLALSPAEQLAVLMDAPEVFVNLLGDTDEERRSRVAALRALRAAYPGPEGLADLIKQLTAMRAGDEPVTLQRVGFDVSRAAGEVLHLARDNNSDLAASVGLFRFPFILARRTIGGAEGTEIVVSVRERDGAHGRRADVAYFHLHAGGTDPIKLTYRDENLFGGEPALASNLVSIPMGQFARLTLKPVMHQGEEYWVRDGGDIPAPQSIGESLEMEIHTGLTVEAILSEAYRSACLAGIEPQVPLGFGALSLTCPPEP